MLGKRPRVVVPLQQQCHYQYKEEQRIAIHSGFSSSSNQNLSSTSIAAASVLPSASMRRQVIGFEVATAVSSAQSGQATTIAVSLSSSVPLCEVKRSSQGGGLTAALLSADQKGVLATDSLQSISTTNTIMATTTTTTTTTTTNTLPPTPTPTSTPTLASGPLSGTLPVSTPRTDRKCGERGSLHVRHCRGCIFLTSSSSSSSSPASSFEDAPRMFPATPLTPDNFLKACFFCARPLSAGKDIYMYRGDRAFCSVECRYQQIVMDERCSTVSSFKPGMPNRSSSSHYRRSRALTTATASAA